MSVRRVIGTETEYAVMADRGNPVQWSFDVIAGAGDEAARTIRWDYRQEDPINDMRGQRLERAAARPEMLTDEPQPQITNVLAANGGRLYVDHAHPEYSSPETDDPFTAVVYDTAGDVLMRRAAACANAEGREDGTLRLYRNNVDGKGASWGSHENYLMRRDVPFDTTAAMMTAHFITRQQYTGSGRIGLGERGERPGYQLSQRADYFHMQVALQTTFDRPIVNTRDESHAPADMRRLHVIVGDANRMDVPRVLKLGTTSMLLWTLEHADEAGIDVAARLEELRLDDPVDAMHRVSHDLTLAEPLAMAHGGTMTAWQIQVMLSALVYETAAAVHGTDTRGEPVWPDRETRSVMAMWKQALLDVAAMRHADDGERLQSSAEASRLEWLCKWQIVEGMRRRLHPSESFDQALADPRLQAIDLRWASLDESESIYAKVRSRTERTASDEEIAAAVDEPPVDTRAWLRGTLVRRWPQQLRAVSWTRVTTRDDADGRQWTLDMSDPRAFTQEACADALADADDAWQAVRALGGAPVDAACDDGGRRAV